MLPVIDSTNSLLKAEAQTGKAAEGAVIMAEHQTDGHGRLNRSWESPPGKGLLFSTLLYPKISEKMLTLIGLMASMAVLDGIREVIGSDTAISLKWPNDLLVHGKKICGILSEGGYVDKRGFVVVGIGLNVNQDRSDFPAELRDSAGSLYLMTGQKHSRIELLRQILISLEKYYLKLQNQGSGWIASTWIKRAGIIGESVTVSQHDEKISGTAVGIAPDGALQIEDNSGDVKTIYSGDVM